MPILSYAVKSLCFLVSFMQSQYMNLLYCYSCWVFKVRVIINGCILMSQLLIGLCLLYCYYIINYIKWIILCFRCCLQQNPPVSFYIKVFCGSRAEVVLQPIFVTWLCRACIGTRDLISLNFSGSGLVSTMSCGSRAEVVLRQFFVTWLCRSS